ncbi:MAG TPA: hypothetical protein VFN61_02900 [Acidimicrobiales bacterium]|nr:hypothetical protein [Acidimicrobiales bacterium]
MPGMTSGLGAGNPVIVAAFESALLHQGAIVAMVLLIMAVAWRALRLVELHRSSQPATFEPGRPYPGTSPLLPEPAGRRALRVAFGLLWVLDGLLQAQPRMPLGMPSAVMQPAATTSPHWVQDVVNFGATIWSFHPVQAPASAMWIQFGTGTWLLVAPRGTWSRLAGLVAATWGAIVWVFGEAFGGLFSPGFSWMYGAPGAALVYVIAGVLVVMPERCWDGARIGRMLLRLTGLFFLIMAVLQAWPGRGFWRGSVPRSGALGNVAQMVRDMALTPQPRLLASWLKAFEAFDTAHGFAVNLFVVSALAALGAALIWARAVVVPYALGACWVVCLADWVLVQDLGFLGGLGTDPNSMVPTALFVTAAFLAVERPAKLEPGKEPSSLGAKSPLVRQRVISRSLTLARRPGYLLRTTMALGGLSIVVLGAAPMALASMQPAADPIIARAIDGEPQVADFPAPGFHFTDQQGRSVSLVGLRGKVIALTFLNPKCTNDFGMYFREADAMLAPSVRAHVVLAAVVANPAYDGRACSQAYDHREGQQHLGNWLYMTGPLRERRGVWASYAARVPYGRGRAAIGRHGLVFVIDAGGRVRRILHTDQAARTEAERSSLAEVLAGAIQAVESRD